jgi:hypothetical protein
LKALFEWACSAIVLKEELVGKLAALSGVLEALRCNNRKRLITINASKRQMACEDFIDFYQAIPVTILTAVSIFGIFYIYAMQQRDDEQKNIKVSVDKFKESLSQFSDIKYKVSYLLIPKERRKKPQETSNYREILNVSKEELNEIELQLIYKYNKFDKMNTINDPLYKHVLSEFERLQESIYDKFLYVADGFHEKKYSKMGLIEVESWLQKFIPFAMEIDGIKTGIPFHNKLLDIFLANHSDYNRRLHDDEINLLKAFYGEFFKKFDTIRKESLEIEDMLYSYYENKFNSILSSHSSRMCIYIMILNLFLFGLLIPIYMI